MVIELVFAITIRRIRTFYTYKKPTTDVYILIVNFLETLHCVVLYQRCYCRLGRYQQLSVKWAAISKVQWIIKVFRDKHFKYSARWTSQFNSSKLRVLKFVKLLFPLIHVPRHFISVLEKRLKYLTSSLVQEQSFKGELNPKIDFSLFEHLDIVVQKISMLCNESTKFDWRLNMRCQRLFMT